MADISDLIRATAARYGLDPEMMVRIAHIESGMNPNSAHPKSSARGLYQFMTAPGGSWQEYGRGADVFDPAANADAGMRYTRDNIAHLKNALGRDPTPGEIYLAHQQGRAGAAALLANPQQPAVQAISGFYKNPQTAAEAISLNGGNLGMTAGDFARRWTSKFDGGGGAPTVAMASATPTAPQAAQPNMNPQAMMAANAGETSPLTEVLQNFAQQMAAPQQPLAKKKKNPVEQPLPPAASTEIAAPLTFV